MGRLPVVGDMIQVKIPDVDLGKLNAPCLTTIVVEVSFKATPCSYINHRISEMFLKYFVCDFFFEVDYGTRLVSLSH